MKTRVLTLLRFVTRLCVAALLTVCLFSALTPTALVASAFGVRTGMPCCNGKAGHCKLAIKVKPKEPLCGLKEQGVDDAITVVADDSEAEVGTPISGASFTNSCRGECSTCAVAAGKTAKRHKATPITQFLNQPPLSRHFEEFPSSDFSSLIAVESLAPRGPPVA
jgi:hypothetical protein